MMDLVNNIGGGGRERGRGVVVVKSKRTLAPGQKDNDKVERGVVGEVAWLALLNLGEMGFHGGHLYT